MMDRRQKRAKKALLSAFYLAFLMKALVPVGYMPAALADGSPIRLCDAVYGDLVYDHASPHDHDHDQGEDPGEQWEHCPLGALTGAAGLLSEHIFQLLWSQHERYPAPVSRQRVTLLALGFRSRAPPLHPSA